MFSWREYTMTRITAVVVLAVVGSVASAGAEDHHRQWLRFFQGAWTYDWQSEVGDFSEKGEINYTLAAGRNVAIGRVTTEDGDKEIETWGWQSDTETMTLVGHSSNNAYWVYEYTEVGGDEMTGVGHGVNADGKKWEGKVTLTKQGKGFEVRMEGTASGEKAISVGKVVRKKPSRVESLVPEEVRKELRFMVGRWRTEIFTDDVKSGEGTHHRTWAADKSCLKMTWRGVEDGAPVQAFGLSGWDAKTGQVVEHWYDTLGRYGKVCYPVSKMSGERWEGTFDFSDAEGETMEGRCRLEKGKGRWVFKTWWKEDGREVTGRNVTTRIGVK
jgi:hypothetical protein